VPVVPQVKISLPSYNTPTGALRVGLRLEGPDGVYPVTFAIGDTVVSAYDVTIVGGVYFDQKVLGLDEYPVGSTQTVTVTVEDQTFSQAFIVPQLDYPLSIANFSADTRPFGSDTCKNSLVTLSDTPGGTETITFTGRGVGITQTYTFDSDGLITVGLGDTLAGQPIEVTTADGESTSFTPDCKQLAPEPTITYTTSKSPTGGAYPCGVMFDFKSLDTSRTYTIETMFNNNPEDVSVSENFRPEDGPDFGLFSLPVGTTVTVTVRETGDTQTVTFDSECKG
jgi:hypothetical protein